MLLIASFPSWNQPICAWVALVPWLLALRQATRWQTWWYSYLVGLLFFLGSLWWLTKLSAFGGAAAYAGWIVLCAYLALYFAVFGWLVRIIQHRLPPSAFRLLELCVIPSLWVALEYVRAHALSGFGWNLLGYSQQPVLPLIQIADVTGAWGVSFLIVLMNAAIVLYVSTQPSRVRRVCMLCAVCCVLMVGVYGDWHLGQPASAVSTKVAVVQGNIPQEQKWDEAFQSEIIARYARLTREVARQQPHLIIWPETGVPALLGVHPEVTARVQQLARDIRIPLLVGAPMIEVPSAEFRVPSSNSQLATRNSQLTNSAALLDVTGAIAARYDKMRLVPFGEFIPFEAIAPWLRDLLPPIGDFLAGHEHTVFRLPPSAFRLPSFSVLICFEDTFPDLARAFVRRGAALLVTITNDAWFGPTAAAYQHAQASTFRAVELGVPMVRASNTGWSGCIDARGRWLASVHNAQGQELFVEGTAVCEVALGNRDTVYARWGDWFAWACLVVVSCAIIMVFRIHGRTRRSRSRAPRKT